VKGRPHSERQSTKSRDLQKYILCAYLRGLRVTMSLRRVCPCPNNNRNTIPSTPLWIHLTADSNNIRVHVCMDQTHQYSKFQQKIMPRLEHFSQNGPLAFGLNASKTSKLAIRFCCISISLLFAANLFCILRSLFSLQATNDSMIAPP
jgi:hypothetical protein